MSPNLVNM